MLLQWAEGVGIEAKHFALLREEFDCISGNVCPHTSIVSFDPGSRESDQSGFLYLTKTLCGR